MFTKHATPYMGGALAALERDAGRVTLYKPAAVGRTVDLLRSLEPPVPAMQHQRLREPLIVTPQMKRG
ncbi:hypothetical protein [Methylobacterium gregans]|uniref:Uncharacterized protein n=1 Tax=Methylobacterium gregans TaxID=374424 RepID=A0AA37MAU6_9HYPH|nr:hypothetical protein [Methylobacterium gregans]MDQ0521967.1 hypothetical protein [Methylobacterium gregans]GJD77999.1 hypothetical protein NBEOAGPD_1211 [Methylobacterium gregans]GLS51968.1 hypothetical protein GCM10007886_01500 [Methylobacterium gregans]